MTTRGVHKTGVDDGDVDDARARSARTRSTRREFLNMIGNPVSRRSDYCADDARSPPVVELTGG
jgi:hypothetical protein